MAERRKCSVCGESRGVQPVEHRVQYGPVQVYMCVGCRREWQTFQRKRQLHRLRAARDGTLSRAPTARHRAPYWNN
jgi:hypothetical protein